MASWHRIVADADTDDLIRRQWQRACRDYLAAIHEHDAGLRLLKGELSDAQRIGVAVLKAHLIPEGNTDA